MSSGFNDNPLKGWNNLLKYRVSKPKIVGYFSVDGRRRYRPDSSELMYYKPIGRGAKSQNVYLDLNEGIESAVPFASEEGSSMSHLLQWIQLNHADIKAPDNSESWIEPKFACPSGVLESVMVGPYDRAYGWLVCAAMWKGTIYMKHFIAPAEIDKEHEIPQKYGSWGFKFEQYMLSDDPRVDPDTSQPVIESAEFRCMFHRRFGNHSVLFSAGMDGLDSWRALKDPLPLNDLRFVQLKATKLAYIDSQLGYSHTRFEDRKLLHWWAQSFLANNVEVVCGFRDDEGIVRKLRTYTLDEMVEMSKKFWDPADCVMECQRFLNHVASTVVDDCTKTIYKFERKPFGDVVTEEVSPQSEYAFLPSSFLKATRQFSQQ